MGEQPIGRRERKKAATRQAIADAALELFVRLGFDEVSVKDVADKADVSTTTVFKHFPTKEALVFDRDDDFGERLADAVRKRPERTSVLDAVRDHVLGSWIEVSKDPEFAKLTDLVARTPALRDYDERRWLRHADALGTVLAEQTGRDPGDLMCAALARFVFDIPGLTATSEDPQEAVESIFELLANGWQQYSGGTPQGE